MNAQEIGGIVGLLGVACAFGVVFLRERVATWRQRLIDSGLALGVKREEYLKGELDGAAALAKGAVGEAKSWQTKFEHAFKSIEQMERERNVWKGMYYAAGLGHAQAQEMLFREIERLSEKAAVPVRPHLAGLVDGYREKHVLPEEKAEAAVQAASRPDET